MQKRGGAHTREAAEQAQAAVDSPDHERVRFFFEAADDELDNEDLQRLLAADVLEPREHKLCVLDHKRGEDGQIKRTEPPRLAVPCRVLRKSHPVVGSVATHRL